MDFENIIDSITDDQPCFTEEESIELYETIIHMMEEFIKNNQKIITEPDFDDIFDENIKELIEAHFDNDILYTDDAE